MRELVKVRFYALGFDENVYGCNLIGDASGHYYQATDVDDRIAELQALLLCSDHGRTVRPRDQRGQVSIFAAPVSRGCPQRTVTAISGATPMQDRIAELEAERDVAYRQAEDEARRCNDFMRQRDDAVCKVSELEADNARLRAEAERARPVVEELVRAAENRDSLTPTAWGVRMLSAIEAVRAIQAKQGQPPEEVNMGTQ